MLKKQLLQKSGKSGTVRKATPIPFGHQLAQLVKTVDKLIAPLLLFFSTAIHAEEWYRETLYPEWGQSLRIDCVLYREHTDVQDLILFENARFGRVLALDGVIQVTEADEAIYHEMLVHVPLIAHGAVRQVLIIGGGDGGILREVLRHSTVERVVLVEIDRAVIDLCLQWLPNISQGAFDDPRLQLTLGDGAEFVATTDERFDLIICDSTDPHGPGAVLFTEPFYKNCKRALAPKGIFVNQNGVPFLQSEALRESHLYRSAHFGIATIYLAPVPTYAGGFMAFGWASDHGEHLNISEALLEERQLQISGPMKYYSPQIHKASFALPPFINIFLKGH